ncbi:MAG: tRNA (adenosine(37)-N6)-threonylcarbamoyltransferase complex ATPase subunit type 1 TsaE [Candidatus Methylacidiphilales bacterium]|nr:tRNA (adenosine(37)-N6)-threonylcarbamoyltransferase complex ATPase subunit type 1 TsaE [Candidatus Methylacidiphilales bacterium]
MSPFFPALSHSEAETRGLARAWAATLGPGSVVRLVGDLGAGKTTFVQGMAEGLGCQAQPTSPTFSLMHEYPGSRMVLFHWDLYRLSLTTDWSQLDLPDQLPGPGITVVEWPDRYPGHWPPGTRTLHLRTREDGLRDLVLE